MVASSHRIAQSMPVRRLGMGGGGGGGIAPARYSRAAKGDGPLVSTGEYIYLPMLLNCQKALKLRHCLN